MNLDLDETQQLLRDTVRDFLEREADFDRVRECEQKGVADAELWSRLVEHGWLLTPLPASMGGGDGGLVEAALLVEEIERRAAVVPAAEALACAITAHRCCGDVGAELAAGVAGGDVVAVPAVLERSDRFGDVSASVDADGRLTGEKWFVDFAAFATHHVVAACRDGALGLHLVETRGGGVACRPLPSVGRLPKAVVSYDGAASRPLGDAAAVAALMRFSRAFATVQIVADMQQSLDRTVAYTSVREQFGRPIGTFQAVQHHAADMAMHVESTRFLAYEALDAVERGEPADERVAIAKAAASRSAPEVVMLGHQLHGGHGFIEENDLYFFTLRARDRALAWGSVEECLEEIAASIEAQEDWL